MELASPIIPGASNVNSWSEVSVEDIHDRFGEPGAKLGKMVNRLRKILGDKGFLATDSSGKKALQAKTKADMKYLNGLRLYV